ncbi:MAG: hypothetical protein KAI70_02170 [Candidatus Omnitrophica bacterium]|nr:hypothetical protein [Candidatus Omnitrophota bacterium]
MKMINTKGILVLIAILIVIQFGFGLILSPILGKVVVEAINENSAAKINIRKVNIWPLTLSCSLTGLKVFDPDNEKESIAFIKKASVKISSLKLLSKQLVVSKISISGAEIDVKTEPDGSFNVRKLIQPKEQKEVMSEGGVFDKLKGKKDWFGKIFEMIKSRSSTETVEKKKVERFRAKRVKKEVEKLSKGRRVMFKTLSDDYAFQIRSFIVKNSRIMLSPVTGDGISVEKAFVVISNLGVDPKKGVRFDRFRVKGSLEKENAPAGKFEINYAQAFKKGKQFTNCIVKARNVDLAMTSFIYEDSLPVSFDKGTITIDSKTTMINEELNSENLITLRDQTVVPGKGKVMVGIIPIQAICEALDQVNPASFKFRITGTLSNPKFEGFQEALMELIKPYLANITERVKEQGVKAIESLLKKETGESSGEEGVAGEAVDVVKSLFGGKN